jgi:hypothetical protein
MGQFDSNSSRAASASVSINKLTAFEAEARYVLPPFFAHWRTWSARISTPISVWKGYIQVISKVN